MRLEIRPYNSTSKPEFKFNIRVPSELQGPAGKKRAFFRTKEDAASYLNWLKLEEAKLIGGQRVMSDEQRVDCFRAIDLLPPGVSVLTAVQGYLERVNPGAPAPSYQELKDRYLEHLHALGKSEPHLRTAKTRLLKFGDIVGGETRVSDLTTMVITEALGRQCKNPNSRNGVRAYLSGLFEFARRELKVIKENPVCDVRRASVKGSAVQVFTPDEFRSLLRAARQLGEWEMVRWLLIGGFAGIRPSEIAKLDWKNIFLQKDRIGVDLDDPRSYAHRFVKIQPVLKRWLSDEERACGRVVDLTEAQLRKRRESICHRAGVKWVQDGLRHSFATYHLAAFEDLSALCVDMGHGNSKMIERHYRCRMEAEVAEQWWASDRPTVDAHILPSEK